jgi:hypothetical protein
VNPVKNLLKPRETFLILEISPSGTNGLFLGVDEDKQIFLEKIVKGAELKKFLKSPMSRVTQKSWEGKYFFKSHRKVVVSADPSLATTIPIPLDLVRDRDIATQEVVLGELENLIAQAMAKIFNQCRSEASKRLGIHEIDTVLVGAKAKNFKIDNHSVVNPIGFTGKKISLLLELTFTRREIFEDLKQFFNSPDDFYFAEAPQARLTSLARARKLPINLVVAAPGGTSLFVLEKAKDQYPVLYRERLAWDSDAFHRAIIKELGVPDVTGRDLYRMYLAGEMSESAARAFKKMIDPAVADFFNQVEKGKARGSIYIDAPHVLPFPLPHKQGGAHFEEFPVTEILAQLGFAGDMDEIGESPAVLSRHVFPFLEAYFDKTNSDINQKLRRRLHWLAD